MPKPQPPNHFETERLLLRPIARADAEAIFLGYSSSEVATRWMNFTRQTALDEAVAFAERCARCWADGSAYPWAALSRKTGEFLGAVELRVNPPKADFGYIFCERFWRQGFATEAVRPVVDWAFAQPEIFRVWATCHPDNAASARVLSKVGLTFEARLENWEPRPQLGERAGPSLAFAKTRQPPKTR
jgi:ribosomal-protein-alanine N-acetyltransferase